MRLLSLLGLLLVCCLSLRADSVEEANAAIKRGEAFEKERKYAEAIAEYGKAVKVAPYAAGPYIFRGWARHLAKDDAGALADLEMAVAFDEGSAIALYRRGLVRVALGELGSAIEDLELVGEMEKTNPQVHYELGNALARNRQFAEARAALDTAIGLAPERTDYYILRSAVALRLKDYDAALADNDKARSLTTKPKTLEILDKGRAQILAKKDGRAPEASAGSLLGGDERPDPATIAAQAQATVAQAEALPPAPPMPDLQVQLPAQIDFRRLSKADYRAAVSAAMEQLRIVLGPRTEAENAKFEQSWAAAFDFPAEPVVEYLNRLNPLLARFLTLRTATAFTLERFNQTWQEAMTAAGYGHADGADALFQQAHGYGRQLRTLRDDLANVADAIAALGDPPDAVGLKKKRRTQADAAIQYVQDIADGELWTRLRTKNHLNLTIKATGEARVTGTTPHFSEANLVWNQIPSAIVPTDQTNPDAFVTRYESSPIEWADRCFFGHIKTASNYDKTTTMVCGTISADGRRLVELALVATFERDKSSGPASFTPDRSGTQHRRALRLVGLPYFDDPAHASWVNYGIVEDQPDLETKEGRNFAARQFAGGRLTECLQAYSAETTERWIGQLASGDSAKAENRSVLTRVAPRMIEVSFNLVDPVQAPLEPDAVAAGEEARRFFTEDHPWAKIGRDKVSDQFAKLAALLRSEADAALAEAKRRAAEQAAAEKAAIAETTATYRKDIECIEKYLSGLQTDRDRAAAASPCDDTLVRELDFRITGQRSEIQAKQDLIRSLETGVIVHTRSAFDDMCRAQIERSAQEDVNRLATVDRARRTQEALLAKLDDSDRRALVQKTGALLDAGKGMDPAMWREVNAEAYQKVQAKLGADKDVADAETAAWERRVWAAETTETAAGFTFGLLSGTGGYQAAGLLYSFTTSGLNNGLDQYYTTGSGTAGLKAGLFEGTKAVVTSLSDTVDYTWSAVDAYNQDSKAPFRDRLQSVVTATGSKWLMGKATGYVGDAIAANIDLGKPSAEWKPSAKQAIAAAKHQQQMELDAAFAKDFLDTAKRYRTAQLRSGGTASPELDQLAAEVRRKACSVNSSFGAKVYLKTQALPVEQRLYTRTIDQVHADLVPQFQSLMRGGRDVNGRAIGKWGPIEVAPIRNASSTGTVSMDFDLALRQQPDWVPDGASGLRRNAWLTCDGQPVSPREFQETGQKVWEDLYRRQTGYSPKSAFENITTLSHSEAYRDLAWTRITRGRDSKVSGTDAIDWRWSQQAGDVTRIKHYEMLDRQPQLGHYEKLQESCRGTAKDVKTKVVTMLDELAQTKGRTMNLEDRTRLEETRVFWNRVQTVLTDFGSGKMHPLEAEKQIHLLSGGRGIDDLTDRVGTVIESLGKAQK
ncbi:MAG TPA: tetratricopeptide repeat protein [Opitutaceae bacterium]|nr:tetratricopeptide repeat protein [Opitutaceae bacterium]